MSLRMFVRSIRPLAALLPILWSAGLGAQGGTGPAQTPRESAPIELAGYWAPIITEDWRWRMLTPAKGDYASVPLNADAQRVADEWDWAADEGSERACKPFGVGNIMRMPGRLHVTWQGDDTLRLEFDAGTQTRLLHFGAGSPAGGERTWQGHSAASWVFAGQGAVDRNARPVFGADPAERDRPQAGALKVVTTNMRAGHLRRNGVPYSEDAVVTEYFDRVTLAPGGDVLLFVRTVVEDPTYLDEPFITSTTFRLEPDGSKWNPTPCRIDPPVIRSTLP